MKMMDAGYDDWEPPSEARLKLLEARRERSDKISKLMGDYLLKGYKMLGVTCPQCDTILLQTKQGTNYCIACSELDSDADKDDPVTSQAAALTLAREREITGSPARLAAQLPSARPAAPPGNTQSSDHYQEVLSTNMTPESPILPRLQASAGITRVQEVNASANSSGGIARSQHGNVESDKYVTELLDKMDWATEELRGTKSVEYSIQLCQLIKSCAEAVSSIKAALKS